MTGTRRRIANHITERELMLMVSAGMTGKEIGLRYGFKHNTVTRYIKRVTNSETQPAPADYPVTIYGPRRCAACKRLETWECPVCGQWCLLCWFHKLGIWPRDFWEHPDYGTEWLRAKCPELV